MELGITGLVLSFQVHCCEGCEAARTLLRTISDDDPKEQKTLMKDSIAVRSVREKPKLISGACWNSAFCRLN